LNNKKLHIISFNIPYPPNYGGIIEIFHKIRILSKLDCEIYLHCFYYGREFSDELNKYCSKVFYYKRNTSIMANISLKPYIVNSRYSEELIKNLISIDAPILFEGLHCTYFINHESLKNRQLFVRAHNIEHEYYYHLARYERHLFPKLFFTIESLRLRFYENVLKNATILAITKGDYDYFKNKFDKVEYIGPFHPSDEVIIKDGKGDYILYHGNLSVTENINAVIFLIKNVFSKITLPVKIAGKNPPVMIEKLVKKFENICLIKNPMDSELTELIRNAQINVLPTFQNTGIKLKLLAALFNGRHCLVNKKMIENTMLDELCVVADTPEEFIMNINRLFQQPFENNMILTRKEILKKFYLNDNNAKKLLNLLN
jgi:hypothetical protein